MEEGLGRKDEEGRRKDSGGRTREEGLGRQEEERRRKDEGREEGGGRKDLGGRRKDEEGRRKDEGREEGGGDGGERREEGGERIAADEGVRGGVLSSARRKETQRAGLRRRTRPDKSEGRGQKCPIADSAPPSSGLRRGGNKRPNHASRAGAAPAGTTRARDSRTTRTPADNTRKQGIGQLWGVDFAS